METAFLIRLLIAIGVIWLVQLVMDTLSIKDPAKKIIFGLVVLLSVLYIVLGSYLPF